jgi:hypothetical protein
MQSLAESPSPARAVVAERRQNVTPTGQATEQSGDAKAPKGRNALMGALMQALHEVAPGAGDDTTASVDEAGPSPGDRPSKHALHDFVHELFAGLRPTESEGRHGRGFAWGRTSAADLAQRLDALVQRLQGAPTPAEAAPVEPTPQTPRSAGDAADSPLRSAFNRLIAARNPGETPAEGGVDGADALIALIQRMSRALAGDSVADAPVAGSLLDVTA